MAKRTITVTEQIEVDVDFPLYVRIDQYSVLHVLSNAEDGILVCNYTTYGFKIQYMPSISEAWLNRPIITREEFESEFRLAQEKINQLL